MFFFSSACTALDVATLKMTCKQFSFNVSKFPAIVVRFPSYHQQRQYIPFTRVGCILVPNKTKSYSMANPAVLTSAKIPRDWGKFWGGISHERTRNDPFGKTNGKLVKQRKQLS